MKTTARAGSCAGRSGWLPATGIDFPGATQVLRIRRDKFEHLGNRLTKQIVHGVTSLTATQASPETITRLVQHKPTLTSPWVVRRERQAS